MSLTISDDTGEGYDDDDVDWENDDEFEEKEEEEEEEDDGGDDGKDVAAAVKDALRLHDCVFCWLVAFFFASIAFPLL